MRGYTGNDFGVENPYLRGKFTPPPAQAGQVLGKIVDATSALNKRAPQSGIVFRGEQHSSPVAFKTRASQYAPAVQVREENFISTSTERTVAAQGFAQIPSPLLLPSMFFAPPQQHEDDGDERERRARAAPGAAH